MNLAQQLRLTATSDNIAQELYNNIVDTLIDYARLGYTSFIVEITNHIEDEIVKEVIKELQGEGFTGEIHLGNDKRKLKIKW